MTTLLKNTDLTVKADIDELDSKVEANTTEITANKADIANHEQRIDSIEEAYVNKIAILQV